MVKDKIVKVTLPKTFATLGASTLILCTAKIESSRRSSLAAVQTMVFCPVGIFAAGGNLTEAVELVRGI